MTTIFVPYHLDEQLDNPDFPLQPDETVIEHLPPGDIWSRVSSLYDRVADVVAGAVRAGERPVVASGDCTTSLATVAGLQRAGVTPAIVWFDAHGDVQTLETTTSGYLGGMPLRMLVGYGRPLVADRIGLADVPEDQVLLVDARDLDPAEADYLSRSAIRRCDVAALAGLGEPAGAGSGGGTAAPVPVPGGPLYLHLDFDVADPGELPDLLYPAPGGPGLGAVTEAVRRIVATGRVVAFGAACTWRPGGLAAGRARVAMEPLLS